MQSFKPDCGATPQQIHQIDLETAKAFEGFEVVVATHIDRDHWDNHFVVNSVNSETGLKIQIMRKAWKNCGIVMKRLGYGVKWIDRYKYITYKTHDVQREKENQPNHNKIA